MHADIAMQLTLISPVIIEAIYIKGMVQFEINFWYVLACLKGIQDVSVFVSTVDIFRSNRSYNGGLWSPPQRACAEKSKLNMI